MYFLGLRRSGAGAVESASLWQFYSICLCIYSLIWSFIKSIVLFIYLFIYFLGLRRSGAGAVVSASQWQFYLFICSFINIDNFISLFICLFIYF